MVADPKTADNVRSPKLDDSAILQMAQYQSGLCVGFSESRLSKERERVGWYYDSERPLPQHKGDSDYISNDVYEAVQMLQAQLLDVFSANYRPVKFKPVGPQDVEPARQRTEFVSDVIFNRNCGFNLMRDGITQALTNRAAVYKIYWKNESRVCHVELSQANEDEVAAWMAQYPDAKVVEKELDIGGPDTDDDGGAAQAIKRIRISYKKDESHVRIDLMAPEDFGISPMAESLPESDFCFHRHEMTVSELIRMGYDAAKVTELQNNDRLWLSQEPEKIQRFWKTDDLIGTKVAENGQEAQRVCLVYECYMHLDVDGDDVSQLYKVVYCGNTILEMEPVDRKPFVAFVPLPRPKAFWGHNYAHMVIPTQLAKTFLTRSVINHAMVTNNPRYLVGKGALANPRELMENRFGGLVNVKNIEAVAPLPQASLNPFVFQTIQLIDAQKEQQTGISSLSQGLNKDAISKQNSADMVNELITVSQIRQKIVARNFAENFLRDLYTAVYRLVLENESPAQIMQVTKDQWTQVDPRDWPEDCACQVTFSLGYGEAAKEMGKWVNITALLAKDPALAQWFTPKQHHECARRALEAAGIVDIDNILAPFNQPTQPPPNPQMQAEIAMKNADAAAKQAQAQSTQQAMQLQMAKLQSEERIAMAKLQLEREKLQMQMQNAQDKLAHLVSVDAVELGLQMQTAQEGNLQGQVNGSVK